MREPEGVGLWNSFPMGLTAHTAPGIQDAKGVFVATAAARGGPYIRFGHEIYRQSDELRGLVTDLSASATGAARCVPASRSYAQVTRNIRNDRPGLPRRGVSNVPRG